MIDNKYKELLEKFKITKDNNILYGTNIPMPKAVIPTPWKTYIKFDKTYYYFFYFDEKGITIYPLTLDGSVFIPWDDIEFFKVSHIFILGKMTIKTKDNTYKFQLNRFVFGCPWIKINTKFLEEKKYFYTK